jgi:hypothetical protein
MARAGRATADQGVHPVKVSVPRVALATSLLMAAVAISPKLVLHAADPSGNNGTIKIDRVVFDDLPNNEPHVGCGFEVDFYGFDKGDYYARVTFEAQAPSGDGVILRDRVFIGEDANDGGGSLGGHDASAYYELDTSGLKRQPQQGYHIKLTIEADGSRGADVKHKVFWVQGCRPDPSGSL